jgi:perosamine synthetase
MDEIMELVKKYNLILIEDAAQAHGAKFRGKHVGTFGKSSIFSFYPTKNMTTAEGGMVITNDDDVYTDLKLLREHGDTGGYDHKVLGYNYRMTNIEAAIGLGQLEKLDRFNQARAENAAYYAEHLKGLDWLELPVVKEHCTHCFNQFTLKIKTRDRDKFVEYLKENEIGSRVYYPVTIPAQTLYKELGYDQLTFPVADRLCNEVVSIPVHPAVSPEDREKIVNVIKSF